MCVYRFYYEEDGSEGRCGVCVGVWGGGNPKAKTIPG